MARELDSDHRETTFRVVSTLNTRACNVAQAEFGMVGDKEVVPLVGRLTESLGAVEGHVLYHYQGAVVHDDKVHHALTDDHVVGVFDDFGEDAEARVLTIRRLAIRSIVSLKQSKDQPGICVENATGALLPFLDGSIDSLLYISAIEVDLDTLGQVIEATREAQDIV